MPTPLEIYARINGFIDGRTSPAEMEAWLAPYERAVFSDPDTDLARTVGLVAFSLDEIADGIRSTRSVRSFLRKRLAQQLRKQIIYAKYPADGQQTDILTGSNSKIIEFQMLWPMQWSVVHNELQEAHA